MSTLNVANISDDQSTLSNSANPNDSLNNTTTVDTKFVTNGSAKAWVNFNNVAIATIEESLNISTITDFAEGETQVNIANNMSSATYCITACSGRTTSGGSPMAWIYNPIASRWQHETIGNSAVEGDYIDADHNYGAAHGELA